MMRLVEIKFKVEVEKVLQITFEMALQIMVLIFMVVIEIVIVAAIVNLVYLGM
jgi:hypothetical protein